MNEPAELRERMLESWERAASGWGAAADGIRDFAMPVSAWLIESLALQPGQTLLELAAGPGDTGFMAAELIRPGGKLICSDAVEPMLEVARARAAAAGLAPPAVEFRQLQLEWIDLPTASVDRALCRWGVMLVVDPEAAVREVRRVLRPGGRFALAVWDVPAANPWATVAGRALIELGFAEPPDPSAPGMFSLSGDGALRTLLEDGGFASIRVEAVDVDRTFASLDAYLETMRECSMQFSTTWKALDEEQRSALRERVAALAEPFTLAGGELSLAGRTLVAAADA